MPRFLPTRLPRDADAGARIEPEALTAVHVLSKRGKLAAVARLVALVQADPALLVGDVADRDPVRVTADADAVDVAVLIGQDQQTFAENNTVANFVSITEPTRTTLVVPTIQAQVGLSYTPPRFEHLRFRVGYQFEQWFNLGNVQNSSLNLTTQGGFLRGEIDF